MTTRTASCTCGRLTATTSAEPVRVSVCHCLACQKRSGSVFATQGKFPADAVAIAGASSSFVRVGDEGGRGRFHFCPTCGDTVYYTREGVEDAVYIPVGAFADPGFPSPTYSVYEERKHAWVVMPVDIEHVF